MLRRAREKVHQAAFLRTSAGTSTDSKNSDSAANIELANARVPDTEYREAVHSNSHEARVLRIRMARRRAQEEAKRAREEERLDMLEEEARLNTRGERLNVVATMLHIDCKRAYTYSKLWEFVRQVADNANIQLDVLCDTNTDRHLGVEKRVGEITLGKMEDCTTPRAASPEAGVV